MDQPLTWGDLLASMVAGVVIVVVGAALWGFGYSRGWWGNDDGPGVE